VLYLGAYVLAWPGLVLLLVRPAVTSYPAAPTDAAIATVVTLLLLVGPVAAQDRSGVGTVLAALVLPTVDVFVLGLVLHAAALRPLRPAELLALASLAALLLGDVAAPFVDQVHLVHGRSLADAGWLASKVLFAAAALHPVAGPTTPAGGSRTTVGRLSVTFAALVAVPWCWSSRRCAPVTGRWGRSARSRPCSWPCSSPASGSRRGRRSGGPRRRSGRRRRGSGPA
jgi:hypothetical protein